MRKLNIKYFAIIIGVACFFQSCKNDLLDNIKDISSYNQVYMPQAADYPSEQTLIMADSLQSIIFGVNFGGLEYPNKDISVDFEVNQSLVDSFNNKNGTNYLQMPSGSFSIEQLNTTITKGELISEPLKIKVKTFGALKASDQYLLPVSIKNISDNWSVNEDMKDAYFLIHGVFEPYDRSLWEIFDFDCEETYDQSYATNAIDGNINTFWQTFWKYSKPRPPHYIVINMNENKRIHGLIIAGRQNRQKNGGNPKDIQISVSINGNDWNEAGVFTLENVNENTIYLGNTVEAKYLKITVNESQLDKYLTHIAEIVAF